MFKYLDIDGEFLTGLGFFLILFFMVGMAGTCGYKDQTSEIRERDECLQKSCEHGAIDFNSHRCACIVYESPR